MDSLAVRPRSRLREGDRRHRQYHAYTRAIADRTVLVRRFTAWLEPHREHRYPAAGLGSLGLRASIRAGELCHGGWIHRGIRCEVPVPVLASRDGHRPDRSVVAAIPDYATRTRLPLNTHSSRVGRSSSVN